MRFSSEAAASAQPPAQASVLIARIARVVRQRFEQVLTPLGLSQRDVIALTYLRGHGPTPQQLLAERLRLDASSMVCLLNVLRSQSSYSGVGIAPIAAARSCS